MIRSILLYSFASVIATCSFLLRLYMRYLRLSKKLISVSWIMPEERLQVFAVFIARPSQSLMLEVYSLLRNLYIFSEVCSPRGVAGLI